MLSAILFDLDGTLVDAYLVHLAAYRYMFGRFGIEIDEDSFLATYTPDWYRTFEQMRLPPESWPQANEYWLEEAARHCPQLFPGVADMLAALAVSYRLGLVTSGSKSRVLREMRDTGILSFFGVVITGDDVVRRKPDPQGLELGLSALQIPPGEAVYVGDTLEDWRMAQAAGVRFVGVPSRFASLTPDMECDLIPAIADLPKYLSDRLRHYSIT